MKHLKKFEVFEAKKGKSKKDKCYLQYEFKCDDCDEDGIFYDTPFGEIDTTEFANFIGEMEENEVTQEEFENMFNLTSDIKKIIKKADKEYLEFFVSDEYAVIHDGDIHYIYSL